MPVNSQAFFRLAENLRDSLFPFPTTSRRLETTDYGQLTTDYGLGAHTQW